MKRVELIEIEKLYMDCHIEIVEDRPIKTFLNLRSINNKLNCNYVFMNSSPVPSNYYNTVITNKNVWYF